MSKRQRVRSAARRAKARRFPTIGVTPDWTRRDESPSVYEIKRAYADALLMAQGLPLVLPYSDEARFLDGYLDSIDGLLVSGGPFDIDPAEYGEARRPGCGPPKPERTAFERALMERALKRDLPVLGVCGGMQLLNIVLGGSLYQDLATDLPEADGHEQKIDRRRPSHAISVRRGSKLARSVGEGQLMVNSTHHQAVHHLGEGLSAVAVAPDGVIEGIEASGYAFAVGVQWHPELLLLSVPANLGLYRAFVKAAARRM